jgi:poly-gamma-glutamate synthesis protein (capsule biosynthesis protein)
LAVGESPGRPGISALRTHRIVLVDSRELNVLRGIAGRHSAAVGNPGEARVLGQIFRESASPGLQYRMNPYDHFEILKAVRGAKQTSDFTIFSIHAHETASGAMTDPAPADFLPKLFHEVVDAGADVVIAHGQHDVRGIEIYKGKPIFYGVGSLFFQLDLYHAANRDVLEQLELDPQSATYVDYHLARFSRLPSSWYESILPVIAYTRGVASEIRLYPLSLNHERAPKHRGFPTLASGATARRILARVREYSMQFGTEIRVRDDVGFVSLP